MYQITFNTLIKQLTDSNSKVIQNLWCDTIVTNVAMTAIGPVLPGLTGNQLLGNQSIFDFENWLLAPPPSPLRGSCAPWKTDSEFSQASWMSCSQLSAQKYSSTMVIVSLQEEGGHRGLIQYSCYCWLPWPFLYDIKVIVFGGGRQKPFPLLLPSTGTVSDFWMWKIIHVTTVLLFWRQNQMVLFGRSVHTLPSLVANTYMEMHTN